MFYTVSLIIDCNSKKDYQILIIFGTSIPDTTGHRTAVHFPTSPIVCFCITVPWKAEQAKYALKLTTKNVKNHP